VVIAGSGYVLRIIGIVENLILIPLYLKYIGASVYGYWLATGGILAWLGMLDFGVAGIIKQRCAKAYGEKNYQRMCDYFSHGMIAYLFMAAIILIFCWILSFFVGQIFRIPLENRTVIRYAFVLAGGGLVTSVIRSGLVSFSQAVQRPQLTMYIAVFSQLVHFGICLWLILTGCGLLAIPIGLIVRNLVGVPFIAVQAGNIFLSFQGKLKWNRTVVMDYLRLGPTLLLARLGSQSTRKIEPVLITYFISAELATAFFITKKLAEILQGFMNSIRGAIVPGFAHLWGQGLREKTVKIFSLIIDSAFWGTLVMLTAYIVINKSFIILWTSSKQFAGMNVVLFIALAVLFESLLDTNARILGATGRIGQSSIIITIEGLMRIALMTAFLPLFKLPGLPLAAIFSAGVTSIYLIVRMLLILEINYNISIQFMTRYLPGMILLVLFYFIGIHVQMETWPGIILLFILTITLGTSFAITFSPPIRNEFTSIYNKWRRRFTFSATGTIK
jgi:O-antigen/teichoic acid export membrane protein